ncbi:hypothetical protein BDF14DRAFT_1884518 [Spinellus fusiger]|nr:hypothetical protein BDF14DRAFT_1884518 [Spinellus fusiger]
MEQASSALISTCPKPDSVTEDYEYCIYDIRPSERRFSSRYEFSPCPVVLMSHHHGLHWNEELFRRHTMYYIN